MLTYKLAEELGGALDKLEELAQTKIKTKESEAEERGLKAFVAETATHNLQELLGCWFTIRREYEPLLNVLAVMTKRVQGVLAIKLPANEKTTNEG